MSLYRELRRRRVFRSVAVYVVAAVAVLQAGDVLAKALHLPDGVLTLAAFMAIAGLRVVIALAWLFQLTRDGLRRQDVIDQDDDALRAPPPHATVAAGVGIGVLVAFVAFGAYARWTPAVRDIDRSLAVLPFANLSDDAENEYFSDGISEDILRIGITNCISGGLAEGAAGGAAASTVPRRSRNGWMGGGQARGDSALGHGARPGAARPGNSERDLGDLRASPGSVGAAAPQAPAL